MLESLLSPTSIAIIGASRTPGKVGHEIVGFTAQVLSANRAMQGILHKSGYMVHSTFEDSVYNFELDFD